MEKENFRKNNQIGITLIALVVTIVILLILTGVTINMLLGENGIIRTAQEAKNTWEGAVANEQQEIENLVNELNSSMNNENGTGGETPENPEVPDGWDLSKVTPVPSEDTPPVNVPVPKGFTLSTVDGEKTVEDGFVIKQDGSDNEFVWIPVSEERLAQMYTQEIVTLSGGTGVTTNIYSKSSINTMSKPGETGYREPDLIVGNGSEYDANPSYYPLVGGATSLQEFAQDMVDEYQEIHDSIEIYGGFYIGRYELTGTTTSPTVVKGGTVITNTNWYHLKAACMKIVNNEGKQESEIIAKTTMMYGNQWDEVCNWLSGAGYDIEDSTSWGNYRNNTEEGHGEKQTTGFKEAWKANNIYDFAGNCREWTQEGEGTKYRVIRGGDCDNSGSDGPASFRSGYNPSYDGNSLFSTRSTLYIM